MIRYKARFHIAAMSADPRIMKPDERINLIKKLMDIDPKIALMLEEEVVDPYRTTIFRLKKANVKLDWPLKEVYTPVKKWIKQL